MNQQVKSNGSNGTPDMRTYFARDSGADSVNSTGGSSTHTHSVPNHSHTMGSHSHTTNVLASTTTSYEAPSFGEPIESFDPKSIGAKAYRSLADEFRRRHGRA